LNPNLDIIRAQDLDIAGGDDPTLLEWAAQEGRIPLTYDQRTVPHIAYERLHAGKSIAGVIVAKNSLPISQVIEEILIVSECSTASEWINQVYRLPL
jgi:hypothetical protein